MFQSTEKVLWYIIALAGIPYLLLLLFMDSFQTKFPVLFFLASFVFLFDWLVVPFFFFNGEFYLWKKVITIGINLILSTLFIEFTGGAASAFYMDFYYMPLLIACVYGGLWESLVTALLVIILSVSVFDWQQFGNSFQIVSHFLTFFLVAVVLGFVIGKEKQQRRDKERMARQLKLAYEELSSSHSQLQAYTELMEDMTEEMEELVVTDDLTKLYNYRYFQNSLEQMVRQKHCHPFAMIMLDIDHFKQVNDSWGHHAGNVVLVKLAEIVKGLVREDDVVARYGGEEFAILLPNTGAEYALQVAERIRKTVAGELFYRVGTEELRITVSQGVTIYPAEAASGSKLVINADKAMYRAKELGRNRVVMYRDMMDKQ